MLSNFPDAHPAEEGVYPVLHPLLPGHDPHEGALVARAGPARDLGEAHVRVRAERAAVL